MSTSRFGALLGLAFGAIWAVADFEGAVLAALLTGLGYIAPAVLAGRIDLTSLLRQDRQDSDTSTRRQRTNQP